MTEPRGSGPDPIGDFQRWLLRSGARSMTREVSGHIAGAFGLGGKSGDVWETATAPSAEAPECAWCPVCRAARLLRESGPGLASHVAAASDTLAGLVQDAASVVESALAAAGRRPGPGGDDDRPGGGAWSAGTLADLGDVIRRGAGTAAGREADAPAGPEAEAAEAVWAEATGNGAGPAGHAAGGNGTSGKSASGNGGGGSGAEGNGAEGSGAGSPDSPASPDT